MWECRTIARSPAVWLGIADRDEVERAVEVPGPKPEVAGADRRDEAVVERLGDVEGGMDPVPAGADGELVSAELARMEEAEQLHASEVGLEQVAVLALVVLAQVPGVVRLLRAWRGEGEPVRRRDVGDR